MSWRYASVAVETAGVHGGWNGCGADGADVAVDGGGVADGGDGPEPGGHTPSSSHLCSTHHAQQRLSILAGSS